MDPWASGVDRFLRITKGIININIFDVHIWSPSRKTKLEEYIEHIYVYQFYSVTAQDWLLQVIFNK